MQDTENSDVSSTLLLTLAFAFPVLYELLFKDHHWFLITLKNQVTEEDQILLLANPVADYHWVNVLKS